jgi:hypothetical protein
VADVYEDTALNSSWNSKFQGFADTDLKLEVTGHSFLVVCTTVRP